ncbi:ImmA/IrrE family metallo-endopeptidase [Bacillus massiliigorillae]|uniref:ImmA/IrrE family metallo-endopeptidase n=1 Tax=Bacillus massiliigorillae TaxID=1243664 RepID=UPI0003A82CDF|nr:ImmA/IrrE family metallo-endopeptidase [Bacillus massiliigorillae]
MHYENLLLEYDDIKVKEKNLQYGFKGLYKDGVIIIDKSLSFIEKGCILAEELGHHNKTVGNILDQSKISNVKQEKIARGWAHNKIMPLSCFVDAYRYGCRNRYEVAEYLNVTEEFLQEALDRYIEKYGDYVVEENLIILLNPLNIIENR